MKTLSETWFAEGYIDFELKKYTLLAYLQEVNGYFDENKLYPQLGDIIFHYNNLVSFRENKKFLQDHFPKKLTGIQLEKLESLYEHIVHDDELMNEMEDIINYSTGEIKNAIENGTGIYEFVEEKINITPVGIIPLDVREGYFFLSSGTKKSTNIYTYRLSIFERHDEEYRSIRTNFIEKKKHNLAHTYEHIKSELIRHRNELPNPAVYSIETELSFPLDETLLPIATRSLVKYFSSEAA